MLNTVVKILLASLPVSFSRKPKFIDDGPSAMTDSRAMDDSSTILEILQKANKRVLRLFDAKQYDEYNDEVSAELYRMIGKLPMQCQIIFKITCNFSGKSYIWNRSS